jgi:putative aldouronate transport system permease protein
MVTRRRSRQLTQLYVLVTAPLLVLFLFSYLPMAGLVIAFQDYNIFKGFFGSKWAGLAVFKEVFAMKGFWLALRNTFMLNGLNLLVGFPAPIVLALMLNEVRHRGTKKFFQSTLYLPHFLSWAIIGSLAVELFADRTGLINVFLASRGLSIVPFLSEQWHWLFTYQGIWIWQNAGWMTIIYLSSLTAINPELYEAAEVDGAGRWRKIWSITLPGIASTIVVLLIIQVGRIVNIGFEQPYIIGNDLVRNFADVISTFVYRIGILSGRYNVGAAAGLFQSVVGLVFLLTANAVAKRFSDTGIW